MTRKCKTDMMPRTQPDGSSWRSREVPEGTGGAVADLSSSQPVWYIYLLRLAILQAP